MKKFLTIGFLILAGLNSCAFFQSVGGEPAAAIDATPPPNYNPIFIKQVQALPPDPPSVFRPALQITRIDAQDPNRVKIYVQFTDSAGSYYSGASLGKWRTRWCGINDKIGPSSTNVTKYNLKEVTQMERVPLAMALVLDHSGSMGEDRALAIQRAAHYLIDKKKPEDAIAVVKYDDHVVVEAPLSTNADQLRSQVQINGLTGFGNYTAVVDGGIKALEELKGAIGYDRKAILLFTDGLENSSKFTQDSLIKLARGTGVIVCAVGFGDNIDESFMMNMASPTGGIYHHMYRTQDLDDVFEDIYRRLKNFYVIDYPLSEYGLHTVNLKYCLPNDTLTATGEYDNTPNIGAVALLDVQFDLGKADITPSSMVAIDNIVTLMKAYPTMTVEVRGHTDNTNKTTDPDFNMKLSQKRAEAVKAALVKKNILAQRIGALGFGDTRPVGDNATEEGRARNRRTEFVIVSR
jgi:outer membrane protein OmpA-like peptidoglycan-associated protein/uncharacterized protein YegL